MEWAAIPSSRGSSQPRDQTCISYISCIGRFFTTNAAWETQISYQKGGQMQIRVNDSVEYPAHWQQSWAQLQAALACLSSHSSCQSIFLRSPSEPPDCEQPGPFYCILLHSCAPHLNLVKSIHTFSSVKGLSLLTQLEGPLHPQSRSFDWSERRKADAGSSAHGSH